MLKVEHKSLFFYKFWKMEAIWKINWVMKMMAMDQLFKRIALAQNYPDHQNKT
jgi:hypothetical protein